MSKRSQKRAKAVANQRTRQSEVDLHEAVGVGVVRSAPTAPPPAPPPPPPPLERTPPVVVLRVTTAAEAEALAARLLGDGLGWPVVVVTTAAGQSEPFVDPDDLLRELAGIAEVVVMPTGDASWAFSRALPALTQVFGGASRVYTPDREWLRDPYRSALRFAYSRGEGARVGELLASDAMGAAFATRISAAVPTGIPVTGEVLGVVGSRGLVRLESGQPATIWAELTATGVPAERLVRKGQQVSGLLDAEGRVDVREMTVVRDAADLVPTAVPSHVLARVARADDDVVGVELVPGAVVDVPLARVGDVGLPLGELFAVGDVVVGTWWEDESEAVALRLDMWDGVEAVEPAPAILEGGPPWLEVPTPEEIVEDSGGAVDAVPEEEDDDGAPPPDTVAAEVIALRQLLAERDRQLQRLTDSRAANRRLVQQSGGRARRAGAGDGGWTDGLMSAYLDPVEQLEFEVLLEWASRISAPEKATRPLRSYRFGPAFLDSLTRLEGVSRRKVVKVMVEVLTGLVVELDGRDLHQLRENKAGGSPTVVRGDGGVCWRVALQRETASARRMHYWELPDRSVEFSRVGKHDEVEA